MHSFLLIGLTACALQRPPEIDREQIGQWIDDAMAETVTHLQAENTERALEAWTSANHHFESHMEPALRYYVADKRKVTELEYQLGRIRDRVTSGEVKGTEVLVFQFLDQLDVAADSIPQSVPDPLTH